MTCGISAVLFIIAWRIAWYGHGDSGFLYFIECEHAAAL